MASPFASAPPRCANCGTELSPNLLSCPNCHALVHAARLKELAAIAERATAAGDAGAALGAWREAIELLPPYAPQHAAISRRIDELSRAVSFSSAPKAAAPQGNFLKRGWAGLVAVGLLVLSKAKFLLLGLTKLSTFGSMLAFFGVYWAAFGWPLALGFVVCIYIHEMGHVWSLSHYGIKASAPMFIPGFGALVRLKQHPANVHEDARVGLAGPIWGGAAALAAWGVQLVTGAPIWGAIAHLAAWLNLFNLIPIWQLDGGRGMVALSKLQRWMLVAVAASAFAYTREPWLVIIGLVTIWQAFRPAPAEHDWGALSQFSALLLGLSLLSRAAALPGMM